MLIFPHQISHYFTLLYFTLLYFTCAELKAQDLSCNSVNLYYCPVLSANTAFGCAEPGCFRFHYNIYFQPNPSNDTIEFKPDFFSIIADLQVNGSFSEFNIEETEDCSPSGIIDSATIESHQVTIFFNGPSSFNLQGNPYYLATLVVDAYPGEKISLTLSGEFGLGTEVCEFTQVLCNGGDEYIQFEQPDPCDSLTFEFGNAVDSSAFGGPIVVPVFAEIDFQGNPSQNPIDYNDLDILIEVESDQPVYAPQILSGTIPSGNVDVIGINPGQFFTIYAKASNIDLYDGINKLFDIRMPGPVMQSLLTNTTLKLINGRAEEDGEDCCTPALGDSLDVQYDFNGTLPCDSFVVNVGVDENFSGDCQLKLDVSLEYTDGPQQFSLHQMLLDFDLGLTGNVTIDTVILADWSCPSGSGSPCDTCLIWTPEGNIRYCFNLNVGSGMLVTSGDVGLEIIVNTPDGCIDEVTFTEALVRLANAANGCVPEINIDAADFPACSPIIAGYIFKEDTSAFIKNDSIFIRQLPADMSACNYEFLSLCPAPFSMCACSKGDSYEVKPYKNDFPLCGVTTSDLVLFRRHLLQLDTLSPYQIIAGDANNNGTFATSDLVVIQQLILFIIEEFPSNQTSWRFVQADYSFPNPLMPGSSFPEKDTIVTPDTTYFIGIKIGDANLTCDQTCTGTLPLAAPQNSTANVSLTLSSPYRSVKKGEVVTFSVRSNAGGLIAFQAGLQFDPEVLHLKGPSKGDLEGYTPDNFGLTQLDKGRIRTLWFAFDEEIQVIRENDVLFNLTFTALRDIPDLSTILRLDDGVLENLAYGSDDTEYRLSMAFAAESNLAKNVQSPVQAVCRPNPFTHSLTFDVTAKKDIPKASLWIFDAFGRRLVYREVSLAAGRNELLLEDTADLPAGVLNWRVQTPFGKATGIVVKQ